VQTEKVELKKEKIQTGPHDTPHFILDIRDNFEGS
jgi:hypothetical protein